MAKSISLALEMKDLYLVDDAGNVTEYSLAGDGVDISLDASGNLQAALSNNPSPGTDGVIRSIINNQWTLEYSEGTNELFYIGIQDIIGDKSPEATSFDLSKGPVNIRLMGSSHIVTS